MMLDAAATGPRRTALLYVALAFALGAILALGGLSNQEKAKRAIWYGIIGMALAVIATFLGPSAPR